MTATPGWEPMRRLLPWLPMAPYLVGTEDAQRLRSELRGAGFELAEAELAQGADEPALLQSLGDALGFPDYYRPNWDAFDDCVGDLMRQSAAPTALLIAGADHLLRSDPHAFVRAAHLLSSVVEVIEREQDLFRLEVFYLGRWVGP